MANIRKYLTWILACGVGVAALAGLREIGQYYNPKQEAWAAWVQAVGSIAAILGSFMILRIQHQTERANDRARRDEQEGDAKDGALAARATAVRNILQITSYSLQSAGTLVRLLREGAPQWEAEKYMSQIFQLRAVLDSIIKSDTDHIAMISALDISMILTELHNDIRHIGGSTTGQILDRCQARIDTGVEFLDRLINLKDELITLCQQRNIPLEIADFRN